MSKGAFSSYSDLFCSPFWKLWSTKWHWRTVNYFYHETAEGNFRRWNRKQGKEMLAAIQKMCLVEKFFWLSVLNWGVSLFFWIALQLKLSVHFQRISAINHTVSLHWRQPFIFVCILLLFFVAEQFLCLSLPPLIWDLLTCTYRSSLLSFTFFIYRPQISLFENFNYSWLSNILRYDKWNFNIIIWMKGSIVTYL